MITLIPGTQDILNTVAVLTTLFPLFVMLKTLWLNLFTITNLIQDAYNNIRDTIK